MSTFGLFNFQDKISLLLKKSPPEIILPRSQSFSLYLTKFEKNVGTEKIEVILFFYFFNTV